MHSTSQKHDRFLTASPAASRVKLTRFDRWWASLLPPVLKRVLPPWQISAGLVTLMAFYTDDPVLTTMIVLFWASMSFAWFFRKVKRYVGHFRWIIPAYHAALSFFIMSPVLAQTSGAACSAGGLFAGVTNFVSTLFSSITFGDVGGGTLSELICQVVGFLTIALLLSFLGVIGYTAFQIGYSNQPVSTVLNPLMAFLIFAGASTVAISVMVGTGGTGT